MDIIDEIRKNAAVKNYWTKILGSDHLNAILEHPWLLEKYMVSREAQRTREAFLAFRPCEAFLKKGEQFVPEDTLFRPFALRVVGWLYMSLKPEMDYDCCGADGFYGLVKAMGEKLMSLCIRCLIGEMKERKARGELNKKFSGNPTEVVKSKSAADGGSGAEYAYFCTYYLEDYEFQNQLFLKYPVMTGMLLEKTEVWTAALKEMLCRFENDCEVLADRLGIEAVHLKITDIAWGLSDEHIYGRMVMRLTFNHKYRVYYKPHALDQAAAYDKIHIWLLLHLGYDAANFWRIAREGYGWEMEVSHLPCGSLEEVREFYERAGVQLCLAYILGISDIHKGNLIAHGKYPVIIDLETFPGILGGTGEKPWEYTVQRSGFLPVIGPGNVSLSAIGVDKIQNTSYKMPTVTHRATSDMTMGFKTVVVKGDENFPVFEGKVWDVKPYISHLIKGFEQAFEYILAHKDMFYDITVQCLPDFSRHVLQNTQVYFMYHNVSLRPELMRYGELRALTLRQMEKSLNCKGKFQARILDYEMDCVYHLCFPVYYAHGRDLYMGNGIRIQDYFTVNGAQRVKERICLLSKNDLILQRRIIELAFLPILKKDCHYNSYCMETRRGRADVYTVREIGHMLVSDMGIYGNGQLWLGIRYDEHGRAALKPVDDYFYGGLGGIAVFLKAAGMFYKDRACEAAFEKVLERLDSHTQIFCQNQKNKEHRSMGLFDGEASMVYTYRLLYQMTGCFDDLRRACRHCDAVLEHLGDVYGSDLLGGKAGVIFILAEMYKETEHKKYLDGARELFRQLMGDVQVFSCGIGWINKNQTQPLAGMAHGGSGIALALAALWSVDKNDDYLCVIEKILSYEDSLYCSSWKNWKDMRGCSSYEDAGANTMAWCHGAAGIYAARKSIYTLTGHWYGKVLVDDALLKLKDAVKTDQCLCHGNLGLWRILNGCTVNVDYGDKNSRNGAGIFESADSRQASGRYLCRYLSVEDRLNPGFMNGLSGIGYTLLQEAGMELPEVLFLEIV